MSLEKADDSKGSKENATTGKSTLVGMGSVCHCNVAAEFDKVTCDITHLNPGSGGDGDSGDVIPLDVDSLDSNPLNSEPGDSKSGDDPNLDDPHLD